jgi:hypothetical protein
VQDGVIFGVKWREFFGAMWRGGGDTITWLLGTEYVNAGAQGALASLTSLGTPWVAVSG